MSILNLPKGTEAFEEKLLTTLASGGGSCLSNRELLSAAAASVYATENDRLIENFEKYAVEKIGSSEINKAEMAATIVLLAAASKLSEAHFSESRHSEKCATSRFGKEAPGVSNIGSICHDNVGLDFMQLAASCVINIHNSVEIGATFVFEQAMNKKSVMAIVNIAVLIKAIADQIDQRECKSHRILIVDDEPRLTKILKRSIEKRTSHVVKVENNSRKALESAREFKPDLILLDMYMPAIGGEELVKEIIKDPKLSNTKVVFLTSLLTQADMGDSGQKIGEHLFLAKPVNPDVLVDTIREQMAA